MPNASESGTSQDGPSEDEKKTESSNAAKKAVAAQDKAHELTQAAAAAGDAEERQKFLNDALQQEIESENLGKVAKWVSSGPFQGMAAGTGVGMSVGALVGVITSLLTGGVGAGIGAAHGPFIRLGDVAGEGVRKVMGSIPGWEATEEQKGVLEKMLGQVQEQERPGDDELRAMSDGAVETERQTDHGGDERTWTQYASSLAPSSTPLPSMPASESKWGGDRNERDSNAHGTEKGADKTQEQQAARDQEDKTTSDTNTGSEQDRQSYDSDQAGMKERAAQEIPVDSTTDTSREPVVQKPKDVVSHGRPIGEEKGQSGDSTHRSERPQKKPRKLEVRNTQPGG